MPWNSSAIGTLRRCTPPMIYLCIYCVIIKKCESLGGSGNNITEDAHINKPHNQTPAQYNIKRTRSVAQFHLSRPCSRKGGKWWWKRKYVGGFAAGMLEITAKITACRKTAPQAYLPPLKFARAQNVILLSTTLRATPTQPK